MSQAVQGRAPKKGVLKKGATMVTTTTGGGGIRVTTKKGVMTTNPGEGQSAGTTKWRYVGGTIASFPTFAHGAKVPIQGINAPTGSLSLQKNQNGGQNENVPIQDNKLGFSPRSPFQNNPHDPPKPFVNINNITQADI